MAAQPGDKGGRAAATKAAAASEAEAEAEAAKKRAEELQRKAGAGGEVVERLGRIAR